MNPPILDCYIISSRFFHPVLTNLTLVFISFDQPFQESIANELRRKQRQIKEKKILSQEEVNHGTLEDILLGSFTEYNNYNYSNIIIIIYYYY